MLTLRRHDLLEAITLDQQFLVSLLPTMIIALFDVDDCTSNSRNTLSKCKCELYTSHVMVGGVANLYDDVR